MLHAVSSRSVAAAARSSTTRQLAAGRPAARRLSRARVATVEAKTKEEKKGACASALCAHEGSPVTPH
jgi:hypothetical protein